MHHARPLTPPSEVRRPVWRVQTEQEVLSPSLARWLGRRTSVWVESRRWIALDVFSTTRVMHHDRTLTSPSEGRPPVWHVQTEQEFLTLNLARSLGRHTSVWVDSQPLISSTAFFTTYVTLPNH